MSKVFNQSEKSIPFYEVEIQIPDGPDDVTWDSKESFDSYSKCILYATELHQAGHKVRVYDPYLGKYFDFPKDF